MIIRERRRDGKRILQFDTDGLRAISCCGTESSSHVPYAVVALPPGLPFDAVEMVVSEAAAPKPKHYPIEGSQLGHPEEEFPTGKGQ